MRKREQCFYSLLFGHNFFFCFFFIWIEYFHVTGKLFTGESELTGATNLMAYHSLEHTYSKFSGKKLKEQLSSFLPNLPGIIDTPGHQDNRYQNIYFSFIKFIQFQTIPFFTNIFRNSIRILNVYFYKNSKRMELFFNKFKLNRLLQKKLSIKKLKLNFL